MSKKLPPVINCPKCGLVTKYMASSSCRAGLIRYYECDCGIGWRLLNGELREKETQSAWFTRESATNWRAEALPGARVFIDGKFVGVGGRKDDSC
jgi:hypothetical protein